MDGAKDYNAKQNKPVGKRQRPYDFTHMWNLRNKTCKQCEKREILLIIENNLMVTRGEVDGGNGLNR